MANTKKARSQRKMVVSFTVKTGIAEEFKSICDIIGKVPSHAIEELLIKYNKDYLDRT
jgi:hypothetical protein